MHHSQHHTQNRTPINTFPRHIPLDVVGEVIHTLGQQGEVEEIKKFAGLSSFCLNESRKHIFETIDLTRRGQQTDPRKFAILMEQHPDVAPYIRRLHLLVGHQDLNNPGLQAHLYRAMTRLTNLKCLTILARGDGVNWSNLPAQSLRTALQHLIALPTLEDLRLESICDLPWGDIALSPYLRRLELNDVSLKFNNDGRVFQRAGHCWGRLEVLTIKGPEIDMPFLNASRQGGPLIFNLSHLKALELELDEEGLARNLTEVLRYHPMPSLEALKLQMDEWAVCSMGSDRLTRLYDNWILPRHKTLKHLKISTQVANRRDDPFSGLISTLAKLRQNNRLRTLDILVVVHGGPCTTGQPWGQLAQVLLQHGWTSLQEVQLQIQVVSDDDYPPRGASSQLEIALNNLKHSYLAPLFSSHFKFDFEVIGDM